MGILQDRVALVTEQSGIGKHRQGAGARGAKLRSAPERRRGPKGRGRDFTGDGRVLGFGGRHGQADVRNLVRAVVARWGRFTFGQQRGANARIPIESDDDLRWRAVLDSTVLGAST